LSRTPDACAPGVLDHSSAQLASAQLAKSAQLANTGEVTTAGAGAGAGALKLAVGRGVAAAAVDGLPAIAATTIRTMIAVPRFPIFFLAISSSLSRQVVMRTAVE
jgi:hypothetical protein